MSSLIQKLTAFVSGPQGPKLIDKARQQAAKPENRRRVAQLRARMNRKP